MATTSKSRARRRFAFSDEQVFQAITRLLVEGGIAGVSLPTIARCIGFTHQALTYRFTSRAGLMEAYAAWLWGFSHRNQESIREAAPSPLAALRSLYLLPLDSRLTGIEAEGSPAAFVFILLECNRDPVLQATLTGYLAEVEERLAGIISEAQERGDLRREEPALIADALLCAVTGAAVYSAGAPVDEAWVRMSQAYDVAIHPYLIAGDPSH